MKTSYHHITVFFINGTTARFEKVSGVLRSNEVLAFDYVSASDGRKNHAVVERSNTSIIAFAEGE